MNIDIDPLSAIEKINEYLGKIEELIKKPYREGKSEESNPTCNTSFTLLIY